MLWLLLVGCPPKTSTGVDALPEPAAQAGSAESTPAVVPVVLPSLTVPELPSDPEGRLEVNRWRRHYNAAILAAEGGDLDVALDEALQAVATAPNHERAKAIELLAIRAEAAGDKGWEFAALDALLELDHGEWAVFWNGFIDARAEHDHPRALRYAERAVETCPEPSELIPQLAWAALDAGDLERAIEVAQQVEPGHLVRSDVAWALVDAGRCEEAKAFDETVC